MTWLGATILRRRCRGLRRLGRGAPTIGLFLLCGVGDVVAQEPAPFEFDPWYVLVPIDQPGGSAKIAEPRPAEEELLNQVPGKSGPDLSRVFEGKKSVTASWQVLDDSVRVGAVPELAAIDFTKLVPAGVPSNEASAYLYCRIRARAAATAQFRYGYDDAARIWLNGKLVSESSRPGAFEPLADTLTLDLVAGDNHLFVKVTNAGGAWRFRLRPIESKPLIGRAAAQQKVNIAIERGCEYLVSVQSRDGSWSHEDTRFPGGQTALCVYALLKSGISPRHQAIQRGVAYLKARPALHTYTAGCTLLALWALHDPANEDWISDLADELLSWQKSGMWAYPEGDEPDLSNTQYATLGLMAAAKSGVKIPAKAWRDLISQVLHYQGKPGGFGYHVVDAPRPTGSMTAAGVSVVAIAKDQLTDGNAKTLQGGGVFEQSLEAGSRWLAAHFTITGSPPNDPKAALDGHWGPYYLYGVERACTLLGVEKLGGSDWYWEGASWFLDIQGGQGDFPSAYGESEPNTCFALLFLSRATASFTGKGAERKDSMYQTDDSKSDVWLRASGDARLALWLGGFSKKAIDDFGWKAAGAKGIHIAKIEYLIDGEVAGTVDGNASVAWNGEKYPLQHVFEAAGKKRVAVRACLMIEPETEGGDPQTRELESSEVEVTVSEIAAPELIAQAAAATRNLIRASETKLTPSTQAADTPAPNAVDSRESSGWTCAPGDANPSITLEFERPLRANQLMLSGLGGRQNGLGDWDRATKVEVRINKADAPFVVMLDPSELKTTQCDLPRQVAVRVLEIKIVGRVMGKKYPGRVGFNEIALFFQAQSKK
ncbi:MAG TPA: hypothetical protein VK843_04955 [Planctomycetota bacterium]|nr:hypothetical protein [Planctomycetota bacterium]